MTRVTGKGALGGALVSTFLLVACTSGTHTQADPTTSASPTRSSTAAQQQEKNLAAEAETAVDATTGDDDSFVASGVERVSDGVHTEPGLSPGTAYRLTVACAGAGAADIEFTPTTVAPKKQVMCDGTTDWDRFTGKQPLRIDVRGEPGATGMIAWRIDKV